MVSPIIFYALFAMFAFGLAYGVLQDVENMIVPIYTQLAPMGGYLNDTDSQNGLDYLVFFFVFAPVFFVLSLLFWMYNHAQKPETPF